MTIETLWTGWRARYIVDGEGRGPSVDGAAGSVFTRILDSGLADDETFVVHRGEHTFVIMNAFPYSTGHMLVLPYAEVPDVDDLPAEVAAELWATVTDAVRALRAAYAPEGINVGINMGKSAGGSVAEHLHVHVLPRWHGDSNFLVPIANTVTIPEALAVTWAKVRQNWPR